MVDFQVADAGQNRVSLFADYALGTFHGHTVVRTIGSLWLASDNAAAAWGTGKVDIGLGVISQEAVGASVWPDPNSSLDYPVRGWTFRERCGVFQNGVGTPIFTRCVFDTAAGRKLETGEYYLMATHEVHSGTSFVMRLFGSVRVLLLIP